MAHYIPNILTDYISGGSRSSSRNGGPWGSTIHMRDIISQLDTYNNPDIPINLNFYSKSSQTIAQLTHTLISKHYENGCPSNSHGYIFGGYCDVTEMYRNDHYFLNNRYVFYEEATFNMSVSIAYNHLIHELAYSCNRLRAEGIRPCYATIPSASLEKWNDYRMYRGRTALLLHEERYPQMQTDLNTVLSKVNSFIFKLNLWNEMYTPYVAGTVMRTKTSGGGQRILQFHKLHDGVHADDKLIVEWADKFRTAIKKNRSATYSNLHAASGLGTQLDGDQIRAMIKYA